MQYKIRIETKAKGIFTRRIMSDNYADALEIGDRLADEIDGHIDNSRISSPPDTLSFDELLSGDYGEMVDYYERGNTWQILLRSGWFYTGRIGDEKAKRCQAISKIDAHTI